MSKQVLFIQGSGNGGYAADKKLADSLQQSLGKEYVVSYPEFQSDETAPDYGWIGQMGNQISDLKNGFILVGHSFGASMILKYLSEIITAKKIEGIFLIATPFWSGNEDWKQGFILQKNFAEKLPQEVPVFFYQCEDDEEVPIEHFFLYAKNLPKATLRKIATGGHQFGNDLSIVAKDIKAL